MCIPTTFELSEETTAFLNMTRPFKKSPVALFRLCVPVFKETLDGLTITSHVTNLVAIINNKLGGLSYTTMVDIITQPQQTQITHTHNSINNLGLPPLLEIRNSPTHTSPNAENSGGVVG